MKIKGNGMVMDLEKNKKIEFSIRMLHFHNYITDTQFFDMMEKLQKDIDNSKGGNE